MERNEYHKTIQEKRNVSNALMNVRLVISVHYVMKKQMRLSLLLMAVRVRTPPQSHLFLLGDPGTIPDTLALLKPIGSKTNLDNRWDLLNSQLSSLFASKTQA